MANMILAASIVMIAFVVIMVLIYYLISARGVKKQKQHYRNLHESLKVGQKVQLNSGIIGKLKRVGAETCDLEIKSGGTLEVSRFAISEILS